MYSKKDNIGTLTALLAGHGIRHVVVCPGSRNAPLVHNFSVCEDLQCHPVTDERCAGFFALGLTLATGEPAAVCVTSGSALLNLAPAVAEATLQHQGIIVISADRPAAWIGQQDGQTMPQQDALRPFTACSVTLPETEDAEGRWYVNRLVNEALMKVRSEARPSVHINVPISEPLFDFSREKLPEERAIRYVPSVCQEAMLTRIVGRLTASGRPMIVLGQLDGMPADFQTSVERLSRQLPVWGESLSLARPIPFDKMLALADEKDDYRPQLVIYAGGTLVSKALKTYLRECGDTEFIELSPGGEPHDTFRHLTEVYDMDVRKLIDRLDRLASQQGAQYFSSDREYLSYWSEQEERAENIIRNKFRPGYSQAMAVRMLEDFRTGEVHYANSNAIRLGNLFSRHKNHCNRGINGIDGCISTAAGYAAASGKPEYCVTGDLSFFYDSNALWQPGPGRLRIMLLNNGGGGIFRSLKGLETSPVALTSVAGRHQTSAEGICKSYHAVYLKATDEESLREGLDRLFEESEDSVKVLEVFTDPEEDLRNMRQLLSMT